MKFVAVLYGCICCGGPLEALRRFQWAPTANIIAVYISNSNNVIGVCPVLGNINVLRITAKDSGYQVQRKQIILFSNILLLLIFAFNVNIARFKFIALRQK